MREMLFLEVLGLLRESGLVDPAWYSKKYPDVSLSGLEPEEHYLRFGLLLGREPRKGGAGLNCIESDCLDLSEKVLLDVKRIIKERQPALSSLTIPSEFGVKEILGLEAHRKDALNVLLCGHAAGKRIFGSERSLLDMAEAISSLGFNLIVALPSLNNEDYVSALQKYAVRIVSFNYAWWSFLRPTNDEAVQLFSRVIENRKIDLVIANTIVIDAPLLAARQCGIPAVVTAREMPPEDEAICNLLGGSAGEIVSRVLSNSDYLFANSKLTASVFDKGRRTFLLPNTVDTDAFDIQNEVDPSLIKIGLISSNIPKKGIYDFCEIARRVRDRAKNLRFVLIGPENSHTVRIREEFSDCDNLVIGGYSASPVDAVSQVNVVLNLSHFHESFGRTVVEAMAARRPVIAYQWGAIPELIEDGATGYLVDFKDIDSVCSRLVSISKKPELLLSLGEAGRDRVKNVYGKTAYFDRFKRAINAVFEDMKLWKKTEIDLTVIIPNYNYEHHLEERVRSIYSQTVRPKEIIFLDDCSTDGSVSLAKSLLGGGSIPYRIVENKKNMGIYRQWKRGVEMVTTELVWIAEADDSSSPDFLERLVEKFEDSDVRVAYSQSERIDQEGVQTAAANFQHTDAISTQKWRSDYVEQGVWEVLTALLYRNTIPNVSACVFRARHLLAAMGGVERFRFCGDWFVYGKLLKEGKVAYVRDSLNKFRRHSGSATRKNLSTRAYLREVLEVRRMLVREFPVQLEQIEKIGRFLDSDFKIKGLAKATDSAEYSDFVREAKSVCADRRKIAIVTTNNGSHNGGSEMLWQEAAIKFAEYGHLVCVVMKQWSPLPSFAKVFENKGVRFFYKDDGREIQRLVDFEPDIVVISTGDQDEGVEYFEALNEYGIPYVIVNQLTKQEEYWPLRKDKIHRVREGYLRARKTFFTCWNNHRVMESRIGSRIPNAALHYNPYHIDRNVRIPFPPVEEGVRIAIPARLLKIHKGQHLAIELFSIQKWRDRNISLNLYGEGPDEMELRKLVQELGLTKVHFHPRVPDLLEIWSNNQCIMMSSFMEGLPIVLVGAMLCGRVPVLTDIGAHSEVVKDGVSGFIASTPSVESLDDALERAWQRLDEWEEIGKKAREAILDFLPEDPVEDFVSKVVCEAGREELAGCEA